MSKESSSSKAVESDDDIKILIATDIHLGYEYNKKGGQGFEDSFITFEEILQYGQEYQVDFILLGGDLFHDTKPTQTAMLKCMDLLRKYCLGPREIKIEFLSDPGLVFQHCAYKTVNYEDPNFNIGMPVFSIHGNHDDPSFSAVGSMDLLSTAGLINYFGKWTDLTQVTIPPLVIKKGKTHVALYGLSYINDQRLSRLVRDHKIEMLRVKDIPDCFNICILHQNRVPRKEYEYIPEHKLPSFLNFILWGHEHECRIAPEFITDPEYFISQPGSSVVTSLCEAEAKPKHVGILTVNKQRFKVKALKLKTVRPFVFDNLILEDHEIQKNYTRSLSESVYDFVDNYIENELVPKASALMYGHPKQPVDPLLRLRIFYTSDDELFDGLKLGQKYCDLIANPMDMIIFRKQLKGIKRSSTSAHELYDDLQDMAEVLFQDDGDRDWSKTVQGGIKKHFTSEKNKDKLTVLTVDGLNEALNRFINRGDTDAFKEIVIHQMKKTIKHLETCETDTTENICYEIKRFRDLRMEKDQEEQAEIQALFNATRNKSQKNSTSNINEVVGSDTDETDDEPKTAKSTRGRGTGRGRGRGTGRGRGSRGGGRGRGKASEQNSLAAVTTRGSIKTPAKRQPKSQTINIRSFTASREKPSVVDVMVIDDSD